jgi:hypothetical protein
LNSSVRIELEHDAELFDKPDMDKAATREGVKASIGKRQADAFDKTPRVRKPKVIATFKPVKKAAKKAVKRPARKAAPAKAA